MEGTPPGIVCLKLDSRHVHVGAARSAKRNTLYRSFILVFTFFIYTCYHMSRKPISIVKVTLNDTNWAPFTGDNAFKLLGSLDTAFLFAYAIGMFVSGHIGERMDLRIFLSIGMIGTASFTILFGMGQYLNVHVITYFIGIQVMAGLFSSTGWPSVVTIVASWFGKGKRGLIMGVWNSHTSVGNILGSLIAGYFLPHWGLSFIIPGLIIGVMGILTFLFLVPSPAIVNCELPDHHGSSNCVSTTAAGESERLMESPEVEVRLPHASEEVPITFWRALYIPGVVEFSLCLFFAKLVSYVFLFWLPSYISHATSYDAQQAADLSTVFDLGGILGGILAGVVSDYNGARAGTCAAMLFAAAPMLYVYQRYGSASLAANMSMLLVLGGLVNGPYALITTAVSADLGTHRSLTGNSRALSTVTAIIDGTGSIGAAVGPLLTGLLSGGAHGWSRVFYMLIAADVCALLVCVVVMLRQHGCRCGARARSLLPLFGLVAVVALALVAPAGSFPSFGLG